MNSSKSVEEPILTATIADVGDVLVAGSDASHQYEESRAHEMEKSLTACNRYAPIRAPIIDHIGRSGASDTEALLPAVNQILLTLATTRGLVLANATENVTLTPGRSSWPTSVRPRARITGTREPTTPRRASPGRGGNLMVTPWIRPSPWHWMRAAETR